MSAKAIREATGKDLLNKHLHGTKAAKCQFAVVDETTDFEKLIADNPWLTQKVCKAYFHPKPKSLPPIVFNILLFNFFRNWL